MAGVCLGNAQWRDNNRVLAQLLEPMLQSLGYRLKFLSIAPDFIVNSMGVSVAFVLITDWLNDCTTATLDRIGKMKKTFKNCYVIFMVASDEINHYFLESYFRSNSVSIVGPPFIPVHDGPMALERMLNLGHVHAECKRQGTIAQIDLEREHLVCSVEALVAVLSSIQGINPHDANTLLQGIGSIEEISEASKEEILENTDLSVEKADAVVRFFNDPDYYMTPRFDKC